MWQRMCKGRQGNVIKGKRKERREEAEIIVELLVTRIPVGVVWVLAGSLEQAASGWGESRQQDEEDEEEEDEDEDEADEEGGGLSKSGKELKKLLGRAAGLDESDAEDDDDDDDEDMDEDVGLPSIPAPKQKDAPKEEPAEKSPLKPISSGSAQATPSSSKSAKGKRKLNGEDAKLANGAPLKKVKAEIEMKPSVKDESVTTKNSVPQKGTPSSLSSKTGSTPPAGPVTEDEIRAVLLQKAPVTTQDLVANFKERLKTREDKKAFADILKRISKIQKTNGPTNYVVLRGS